MSGATIGGVVGGAIGFFVGGPTGAYYGWIAGSAIGGYVDPTQIQGPRLQDTRGQSSAVGGPIPRAWGTTPVPCNVIWQQPGVTEHKHTDDGKGSGTETVTYTYTRSYAVMFHLGEIAGVLQIKRNSKIVYDARDDATLLAEYVAGGLSSDAATKRLSSQRAENTKWLNKATIYNGTQTQDPDPTIESYEGVGNVPAYRGRAYMVVTDDETQAGEIAQFEVVIAVCGDVDNFEGNSVGDWIIGFNSAAGNSMEISRSDTDWSGEGFMPSPAWDPTGACFAATHGNSILITSPAVIIGAYGMFSNDRGETWSAVSGFIPDASGGNCVYLNGLWHASQGTGADVVRSSDGIIYSSVTTAPNSDALCTDDSNLYTANASRNIHRSTDSGETWSLVATLPFEYAWDQYSIDASAADIGLLVMETGSFGGGGGTDARAHIKSCNDQGVTWVTEANPFPDAIDPAVFNRPKVHYSSELGLWVMSFQNRVAYGGSPSSLSLSSRVFPSNIECIASNQGQVMVCGAGGMLEASSNGSDWVALTPGVTSDILVVANMGGNTSASIPDATGWYTDSQGNITGGSYSTITPCTTTTIGEIVGDVCELSGISISEYDVSDLTDVLPGYVVARETDGLSIIESLRPIGMFDPAEWDKKQRFIKRGGNSTFAINSDDLVERDGDAFERQLVQEAELLRRVSVGYLDPAANWAPNTQKWERRVGTINARGESTIEISAVLDSDQAATAAKRRGLTAWGEPEKQKFSMPYRLAAVTPTDIGTFTDDSGEIHTVRIMQIDDDSGVRLIEASNNCAEAYSATATGAVPKSPTVTDESLRGPTVLYAMNLDSLRSQDNVPGMYIAACGVLSGWGGCSVELSTDGGATFRPIISITTPATMGYLTGPLDIDSNGGGPLDVFLYAGAQLSSVTASQIADGANASVVLTQDVAELIQFQTATATSSGYSLTILTRGVNDTDPALHYFSDRFVLLDASVIFVPIDTMFAGQTLIFRGVANGTSSDAAEEVSVVYEPPTFVIDGGGA